MRPENNTVRRVNNVIRDVQHARFNDRNISSRRLVTSRLYVADCKLASRSAMDYISARGSRFLTLLPRTRREDTTFRSEVAIRSAEWREIKAKPGK